ncbi:MAG: type II toxin-antitoxin system VapC family toxin [Xenococcaceae cyanobacterium]
MPYQKLDLSTPKSILFLDTHTLIWWLANNNTLREEAKKEIAEANNQVFVSAASAWEIAIKKSIGKLKAPNDLAPTKNLNITDHI